MAPLPHVLELEVGLGLEKPYFRNHTQTANPRNELKRHGVSTIAAGWLFLERLKSGCVGGYGSIWPGLCFSLGFLVGALCFGFGLGLGFAFWFGLCGGLVLHRLLSGQHQPLGMGIDRPSRKMRLARKWIHRFLRLALSPCMCLSLHFLTPSLASHASVTSMFKADKTPAPW